jgi:hypothetical protein
MRTFGRLLGLWSAFPMALLSSSSLWGGAAPLLKAFCCASVFLRTICGGVVTLTIMGVLTAHRALLFSVGAEGKTEQPCGQQQRHTRSL